MSMDHARSKINNDLLVDCVAVNLFIRPDSLNYFLHFNYD